MKSSQVRPASNQAAVTGTAPGKAQDQKLEVALRQFVRGALQGIIARVPNTRNFHTMLAQIESLSSTDPARARWYRALADCTSLIAAAPSDGPVSQLMDPIWDFEIEKAPPETTQAFCSLAVSLVTTNLRFAEPCLRMWVSQILLSCGLDLPPDQEPPTSAEADQMQEMSHGMLQRLVQLTPQTTTLLLRILVFEFPQHTTSSASILLMYVKNLLRVSEYCPSLRDPLLTTIVERLIRMDLEILEAPSPRIPASEEEEKKNRHLQNHTDEDIVFQLEEDDRSASSESSTTSSSSSSSSSSSPWMLSVEEDKHGLVDKLDSLLVLMFEYLNLVRRSDSELCDSVFASLLRIFDRSILRTHGSRFTQYLLFVSCGFEHRYATSFARCLLAFVLNPGQEAGLRVSAAAYLSGFLSHARFLRVGLVTEIFDRLLQWAQAVHPKLQEQVFRRQSTQIGQSVQANTRRSLAALSSPTPGSGLWKRPTRRPFPNAVFGNQPSEDQAVSSGSEEVFSETVFYSVVQCLLVVLSQRLPDVLRHYGSDAGDSLVPQFALIGRDPNRHDSLGSFEDEEEDEEEEDSRAPIWTGSPALHALQQSGGMPPSFSLGGNPEFSPSPSLQPSHPNRSSVAAMLNTAPEGASEDATVYPRSFLEDVFLRQCRIQDLLRSGVMEPLENCCARVQRDTVDILRQVGLFSAVLPSAWQDRWEASQAGRRAGSGVDLVNCSCGLSKDRSCFFPFDPYRLPHSLRYVKEFYRPHQTAHNIRVIDPQTLGQRQPAGSSSFAIPHPPRHTQNGLRRPDRNRHILLGAVDDDGQSSDADNESDDAGNGMVMAQSLYD